MICCAITQSSVLSHTIILFSISIVLEAPIPKMSLGDKTSLHVISLDVKCLAITYLIIYYTEELRRVLAAGGAHALCGAEWESRSGPARKVLLRYAILVYDDNVYCIMLCYRIIMIYIYIYIHIIIYLFMYIYIYIYIYYLFIYT